MVRKWSTITEEGKLTYVLDAGGAGKLTIKEGTHDYGTSWDIYHNGVEIKKGWRDVKDSLKHANEIASELGL